MVNWTNVMQSIFDIWVPTLVVVGVGIAVIVGINLSKKKKLEQK